MSNFLEMTMTGAAVRPVAIKIDDNIKARIKLLAQARHRTAHWLMREAITQYVDREEKRESFRQDTLKAWQDFRTSGDHLSAEKADAWLAELEMGNDIEPPKCQG